MTGPPCTRRAPGRLPPRRALRACAAAALWLAGTAPARGDEPALQAVQRQLDDLKGRGAAPDDLAFHRLVHQDGQKLSGEQFWAAWAYLGQLQNPPITRADLAEVIRTKRESISDYSARYRVENRGFPNYPDAEDVHLAFAGNRYYLKVRYEAGPGMAEKPWDVLMAYDGKALRQFYPAAPPQKPVPHASITPMDAPARERFQQLGSNPLAVSMLIDSVEVSGHAYPAVDLVAFLRDKNAVLFEKPVELRGARCLVLSNTVQKVFLDPAREYTVLRFEETLTRDGKLVPHSAQDFEEEVDHGNGLWLPHKVTRRFFDEATGREAQTNVITVAELKVNQGVKESLFTELIPAGTLVGDQTRDATYIEGEEKTLAKGEALPVPTPAPTDRRRTTRWWLIGLNLMIVILVVLGVALRSRWRRSGED